MSKLVNIDESINVFKNMLLICPNANIGVRYLLPRLFLEKGDLFSVIRHCKQYGDDYSPEIIYTTAVMKTYVQVGKHVRLDCALKKEPRSDPFYTVYFVKSVSLNVALLIG